MGGMKRQVMLIGLSFREQEYMEFTMACQ